MVLELGWCGRSDTDRRYGFFHRKPRYYIEWDISWEKAREEKEIVAWTERFRLALSPYVEGSYINVPDSSSNDLGTYYGDNLPRLQKVKRKYDPGNVLHFEQSIPHEGRVITDKQQGTTQHRRTAVGESVQRRKGSTYARRSRANER